MTDSTPPPPLTPPDPFRGPPKPVPSGPSPINSHDRTREPETRPEAETHPETQSEPAPETYPDITPDSAPEDASALVEDDLDSIDATIPGAYGDSYGVQADYGDALDDDTLRELQSTDGWIDPSVDPLQGDDTESASGSGSAGSTGSTDELTGTIMAVRSSSEPVVEMPEWTKDLSRYVSHDEDGKPTVAPMVFAPDPREDDLSPEQRTLLAKWRSEIMRSVFEPDGYTRDYDAEVDQIRFEDRISGIEFSEFLYRYYPKTNLKTDFNDNTVIHIADKGVSVSVGSFRREVVKRQAEQLAEDALMVMSGNEAVRQSVWDDDLLELDVVTESIESGELDVRDASNAVVKQGTFQLARRGHNVGVIAVYKGGKSALMDHFAMCSLSGARLFGEVDVETVPDFEHTYTDENGETHTEIRPGKLLYLDPERGIADAKMELGRAFSWIPDPTEEPTPGGKSKKTISAEEASEIRKRLIFYDAGEHPINLAAPDDQKHLIEFCNHHGVTRVILDSAMMLSGKTDTLVDTEVDMLFRSWEKVKSKTQIAETYWVLHTSHSETGRAFGSQRWMARLQSIWLLQKNVDDEKGIRNFYFTVVLGRGGTRYPKREWGLDPDTLRPYFVESLSSEDFNEMIGPNGEFAHVSSPPSDDGASASPESSAQETVEANNEIQALHRDHIRKILETELALMGETVLDDGTVAYGGIRRTEIGDLVKTRWSDAANRFSGDAPRGGSLASRVAETLDETTETGSPVFEERRTGRSKFVYLTFEGFDTLADEVRELIARRSGETEADGES